MAKKRKIEDITGDFGEYLTQELKDPQFAAEFLNNAIEEYLEDSDLKGFNAILRYIIQAGNVTEIAKKSNISRAQIYRIFNGECKATFPGMLNLLHALGYQFKIEPIDKSA